MIRLAMKNCNINRKAAKPSVLSSGIIDKYKYLTGEEILPSDKRRVIEQANFTYSSLGKPLEKQTKTIENQGKKQIKSFKKMENNWLILMNLLKKILISIKLVHPFKNKKNI